MQSHIQYSADISPLFTTLANTYPNSDQGQVVGGEREKKCLFVRGHTLIPFASLSTLPRASNPLHCEEVGCWGVTVFKINCQNFLSMDADSNINWCYCFVTQNA